MIHRYDHWLTTVKHLMI